MTPDLNAPGQMSICWPLQVSPNLCASCTAAVLTALFRAAQCMSKPVQLGQCFLPVVCVMNVDSLRRGTQALFGCDEVMGSCFTVAMKALGSP